MRIATIGILAAILASGCATPPTTPPPTATATATTTPTATAPTPAPPAFATLQPFRPTPTPSGAPGPDSLPRTATVEQDGIRLTLTLVSNPIRAGRPTLATVTLENRGERELRWTNDGCDIHAGVGASMDVGRWRSGDPDLPADLIPYRGWFLQEAAADQPIWLEFVSARLAPYRSIGCGDVGLPRSLAAGDRVTQEFIWNGQAARRLGLPPSGPVTISATFERWTRPGPGTDGKPISATLESWVFDGRHDELLSPAEVIDAALRDERFASIARSRPSHHGNVIVEYDLDHGIWVVGFVDYFTDQPPTMLAAFVDPVTGEVFAIRQQRVDS